MQEESKKNLKRRKESKLAKDEGEFIDPEEFDREAERMAKAMWKVISSRNDKKIATIGLDKLGAKRIREKGFKKFLKEYKEHKRQGRGPVEEEREKPKKASTMENVFCGLFLFLFLFFLLYSKLNEEFWRVYKTRGQEIEDYYEVLRVSPDASHREIKKSYRRLVLQYHPDRQEGEDTNDIFMGISKAYEVLSDKEKREIYDSSNGLSVVGAYIKSKTTTLTTKNYRRLVTNSNDFWVIQVFDHDHPACQNLGPQWDKLASTYSFLKFGRVDFKSQRGIQSMIPFRVIEFPFVFIYRKGHESDFVQFSYGVSVASSIKKKLMEAFPKSYLPVDIGGLKELMTKEEKQAQIIHLTKRGLNPRFHFEGQFEGKGRFVATKRAEYNKVLGYLQSLKIAVDRKSRESQYLLKGADGQFALDNNFDNILSLYRFLTPVQFDKETFKRLCNVVPFDGEIKMERTACILIHEDGNSQNKIQEIHELYREDYLKNVKGPKAWLEHSLIDHIVIGTVNNQTQPYLSKLFQHQQDNLLVYFSESKQFKFQGKSTLEDFLEDSLIQDEEDFVTSKAYFSTDFFKQIPEFEQLLRENDFSYIKLYLQFFKQLIFGVIGYTILISFFIPVCVPQLAPYRSVYTVAFIALIIAKAALDTYENEKKYELL